MKLLVCGDFYLDQATCDRREPASLVSEALERVIREHDHAVLNFEGAIGDGLTAQEKSGPNLAAAPTSVDAVRELGFSIVTLANNHAMDFGRQGLEQTRRALARADIRSLGAGLTEEHAREPLILDDANKRVAIANVSHREWGVARGERAGIHGLDLAKDLPAIRELKGSADAVVVITHLGHEYTELQTPMVRETLQAFAESGADVVINHHPHVNGGMAMHGASTIFSSIGNFLFARHFGSHDESVRRGTAVSIDLGGDQGAEVTPIPIRFDAEQGQLDLATGRHRDEWSRRFDRASDYLASREKTERALEDLLTSRRMEYLSRIEPRDNKALRAVRRTGMWRGLWSAKRRRTLLNIIRCETHRELLIELLEREVERD